MAKKKTINHRFESLGEMLRFADTTPPTWESRSSRSKGGDWNGSKDWNEALDFAAHGWPEGRAKMGKALAAAAAASSFDSYPAMALDVAGAYPMPHLAAAGEPFCMVTPAPISERNRPVLRLCIAGAVSSMVNGGEIVNYGAALLTVIDALEAADYRVELSLCFALRSHSQTEASFTVTVKQAQEPLELDRLAFVLASPAMWRRLGFAIIETLPQDFESGYGVPRDPEAGKDFDAACILLPSCQSFKGRGESFATAEKALAAVMPTLQELLLDRHADFPKVLFDRAA
jgi:hypothetical protein